MARLAGIVDAIHHASAIWVYPSADVERAHERYLRVYMKHCIVFPADMLEYGKLADLLHNPFAHRKCKRADVEVVAGDFHGTRTKPRAEAYLCEPRGDGRSKAVRT